MLVFDGPETADYANVVTLNQAYLDLLRRDDALQQGLTDMPESLRRRITNLDRPETNRLAATPFLLFSFRENDDLYWTRILAESSARDLFSATPARDVDTLISAALGFIWQLAQHNTYALRLFSGTTLYWCERIAELTFYRLLDAVRCAGDVPVPRFPEQHELWRKLLASGVSGEQTIREAAQISALQAALTSPPVNGSQTWSIAARNVRAPGLRVAEENDPQAR